MISGSSISVRCIFVIMHIIPLSLYEEIAMMRWLIHLYVVLLVIFIVVKLFVFVQGNKKPNVIIIIADDMVRVVRPQESFSTDYFLNRDRLMRVFEGRMNS